VIVLSINVQKIQKDRLKEVKLKDGSIGKFLDLVLFETPASQYGDYCCSQSCSKEERANGVKMPILGNGKILNKDAIPKRGEPEKKPVKPPVDEDDSEVPF
jgi:hypothetical protein